MAFHCFDIVMDGWFIWEVLGQTQWVMLTQYLVPLLLPPAVGWPSQDAVSTSFYHPVHKTTCTLHMLSCRFLKESGHSHGKEVRLDIRAHLQLAADSNSKVVLE